MTKNTMKLYELCYTKAKKKVEKLIADLDAGKYTKKQINEKPEYKFSALTMCIKKETLDLSLCLIKHGAKFDASAGIGIGWFCNSTSFIDTIYNALPNKKNFFKQVFASSLVNESTYLHLYKMLDENRNLFTDDEYKKMIFHQLNTCAGNIDNREEILTFILPKAKGLGILNNQNKRGQTALMGACWMGRYKHAVLLLESGADPNIQANNGEYAIIKALVEPYPRIVKVLLEYNANPNLTFKYQKKTYTALDWLVSRFNRVSLERLLRKAGGNHFLDETPA